MEHFLSIQQFSQTEALSLIERALVLKQTQNFPEFPQHSLVNLFYENSTRTRVSFELAAKHLQLKVINLDIAHSSESKGEEIRDTIHTIGAMGVNLAVIRHVDEGLPRTMAECAPKGLHVINAGDGTHAHPSQALLDMMTILEKKTHLDQIKVAIVGNLKHSRVANSLQAACQLFQVKTVALVAPSIWLPSDPVYGYTTTSLQEGLADADVVVALRIQHERFQSCDQLNLAQYRENFAITSEHLHWAKKDAMIMHPGPMNRGVEIDSDVADGKQSCIWEQVKNGVFMRMAIIERLLLQ